MSKRQAPDPPREATPDGERNRYVSKVKASLCKRWSVSRMEALYEIADLAIYLWALERPGEAVAVAAAVAAAVPGPPPLPKGGLNYNVWCPATVSHALVSRLGASALPGQVMTSRAALVADAGIARDDAGYLTGTISEARQRVAAPSGPKAAKWEVQSLARSVGAMVLYAELAAAGDALFVPHAADAAPLIPLLLSKLRARLQIA